MNNYQTILEDLQEENPMNPSVTPPFYFEDQSAVQKLKTLNRQLRRAKSLSNRTEILLSLWYIGSILETQVMTAERTLCLKELTGHYAATAKRVYYLFEPFGVQQIMRTKSMTVTMVHKLSKAQYIQLVKEAMTITEAQL